MSDSDYRFLEELEERKKWIEQKKQEYPGATEAEIIRREFEKKREQEERDKARRYIVGYESFWRGV